MVLYCIVFPVVSYVIVSCNFNFSPPPHIALIPSHSPYFPTTIVKVYFADVISIHVKIERKTNRGLVALALKS